jgi:hypothetical protein
MNSESWLTPEATFNAKETPRITSHAALAAAISHEIALSTGCGTLNVRSGPLIGATGALSTATGSATTVETFEAEGAAEERHGICTPACCPCAFAGFFAERWGTPPDSGGEERYGCCIAGS